MTPEFLVQRADGWYLTRADGWSVWRADALRFGSMTEAALAAYQAQAAPNWVIVPVAGRQAA